MPIQSKTSINPSVQPRPAWLRALGHDDPPPSFEADGVTFDRLRIIKHDAFAATAIYRCRQDAARRVLGKFARTQPAFGITMRWLGRWFHGREQRVYARMKDCPNVPGVLGPLTIDGNPVHFAAARQYIAGHHLTEGERPPDGFFPALQDLLYRFHDHHVALVDLHKRDNILVGDDGQPHLFDFQITLSPPPPPRKFKALSCLDPREWLLPSAQRADIYHLMKHWSRHRPDQLTDAELDLDTFRPRGVRVWKRFVRPIHLARRKLFVALRIRTGKGDPATEVAPHLRPDDPATRTPAAQAGKESLTTPHPAAPPPAPPPPSHSVK